MPMPSPYKASDVEVQIAALRAVVHALLRDLATHGGNRPDAVLRAAKAEIAALPHTADIKERCETTIDEIFTGEHRSAPPRPVAEAAEGGSAAPAEKHQQPDRSPGAERERKWQENQSKGSDWV